MPALDIRIRPYRPDDFDAVTWLFVHSLNSTGVKMLRAHADSLQSGRRYGLLDARYADTATISRSDSLSTIGFMIATFLSLRAPVCMSFNWRIM